MTRRGKWTVDSQPLTFVAVPWFEERDYPEILRIMSDSDSLPDTYGVWLIEAEETVTIMEGADQTIYKARLIPKYFLTWCNLRDLEPNAVSRALFAGEIGNEQLRIAAY